MHGLEAGPTPLRKVGFAQTFVHPPISSTFVRVPSGATRTRPGFAEIYVKSNSRSALPLRTASRCAADKASTRASTPFMSPIENG